MGIDCMVASEWPQSCSMSVLGLEWDHCSTCAGREAGFKKRVLPGVS